jgi:hypothetical protein
MWVLMLSKTKDMMHQEGWTTGLITASIDLCKKYLIDPEDYMLPL